MKNLKFKRLLSLLIAIIMLLPGTNYIITAADGPPEGVQVTDMYSPWAYWDIFMAQEIYNIGNEGTYSNFQGNFTWTKFEPVYISISNKSYNLVSDSDIGALTWPPSIGDMYVTRGEVITYLYYLITYYLEIEKPGKAVDYFAANGLIKGRIKGDYQLDKSCTTEEMIVFSVRVYEHFVRKLGLDSKGLFWKITGKGLPNAVYLLGTVHFGDNSIYPLSKAITDAFDKSAYLAVEANIYTMGEEDINYINDIQMITDGKTIKDFISEETYELYAEVCESMGLAREFYDYFKPWAAMLGLNQAMMTGGEASALLGMDMFLLMKAVASGKNIIEIESIKYQMDLFDSFSPELQETLLLSVIAPPPAGEDEEQLSMEEMAELTREFLAYMIEAIRTGNEAFLTEILMAGRDYSNPLMKEYNTKLWDIRDAAMADTIEQYLAYEEAEGDFFVAVGAGHTVGKTGIVQVLIKKGYKVERIK